MADLNLQEIHDTLVSLAFAAGKMILAANPQDLDTDTKLNCKQPPRSGGLRRGFNERRATYLYLYIYSFVNG